MSFTYRSLGYATQPATVTSITIPKPSGLTVGDLMVAVVGKDDDTVYTTTPTGWTCVNGGGSGYGTTSGLDGYSWIGYKVADSGDVAASDFTWSTTSDNEEHSGVIAAFIPSNANPAFEAISADTHRLADATPASATITAPASGDLVIAACQSWQAYTGGLSMTTSGYTVETNANPSTGTANGDTASILAYKLSAAGTETSVEFANSESGSQSSDHPYILHFSDAGDKTTSGTLNVGGSISAVVSGSHKTTGILNVGGSVTAVTSRDYTISTVELKLDPVTQPYMDEQHRLFLRWRFSTTDTGNVNVRLKQGTGTIHTAVVEADFSSTQTDSFLIPTVSVASITDYTDLRVEITQAPADPFSSAVTLFVYDVWLSVPATVGQTASGTLNGGGSITAVVSHEAAVDATANVGGSISAVVAKKASTSATLNVGGSITAATSHEAAVDAELNTGGSITAAAAPTLFATGTLNVGGSITPVVAGQHAVDATLNAGGSITAAAEMVIPAAGTLNVGGSVTAVASKQVSTDAELNVGGSITAVAAKIVTTDAELNGGGGLTTTVSHKAAHDATVNGGGSITSTHTADHTTDATLNGGGSISATVTNSTTGNKQTAGTLNGGGSITGAVTHEAAHDATLNVGGSITVVAAKRVTRTAVLNAGGSISTTVAHEGAVAPELNGGGSVASVVSHEGTATGTLNGGGSIAATVVNDTAGNKQTSGTLNGGGSITAVVAKNASTTAAFNGGGSITTTVVGSRSVLAVVNGGGSVAQVVTGHHTTDAILNVGGSITADAGVEGRYAEVSLDPLSDPSTTSGHTIYFRFYDPTLSGGFVTWTLMDGTTEIASDVIYTDQDTPQEDSYTLLGPEAASIVNYDALSIRVESTSTTLLITDIWLEVPFPPPVEATLNGGGSIPTVVVGYHTTRAFPTLAEGLLGPATNGGGSITAVASQKEAGVVDAELNGGGSITAVVTATHTTSHYQFARPVADTVLWGTWDDTDGGDSDGDLWDEVDDLVENDSPYIRARFDGPGDGAIATFDLSQITDPLIDTDHILRIRSENIPFVDMSGTNVTGYMDIKSDGNQVSRQFFSSGLVWFTQEIELAEASAQLITDYKKLTITLSLVSGNNHVTTSFRKISWIELETPVDTGANVGGSITASVLRQFPGQAYGILNGGGSITAVVTRLRSVVAELNVGGSIIASLLEWADLGHPVGVGITDDGTDPGRATQDQQLALTDDGAQPGESDALHSPGETS